ncbi:hypothetical protein PsYK624_096750 [Phanerochaete sordida]|uniref:Uncharacterized protein n=1 Tax=Phanerochaete sordida TaxID=48140 RepID=A0A9P3GEM9_9APHY|nr:hypothetical protein PsYK624_096750 [Phanerochaete sordida]
MSQPRNAGRLTDYPKRNSASEPELDVLGRCPAAIAFLCPATSAGTSPRGDTQQIAQRAQNEAARVPYRYRTVISGSTISGPLSQLEGVSVTRCARMRLAQSMGLHLAQSTMHRCVCHRQHPHRCSRKTLHAASRARSRTNKALSDTAPSCGTICKRALHSVFNPTDCAAQASHGQEVKLEQGRARTSLVSVCGIASTPQVENDTFIS